MKTRFLDSAFKHGFGNEEAEEVLDAANQSTRDWNEGFGEYGERVLYVGYDSQGTLLEVIVEYCEFADGDEMIVFHIDNVTKENEKKYYSKK